MKTVRFLEGMVEIAQGFAGISEKYLTVQQYILEQGRQFEFAPLTEDEQAWTAYLGWCRHRPRDCYRNAQVAALTIPSPEGSELR